jgi:hypothetical protein
MPTPWAWAAPAAITNIAQASHFPIMLSSSFHAAQRQAPNALMALP